MTKRSRNLTDGDIDQVVSILDGWTGRLNWDALVATIDARTGQSYTRQALSKHLRILSAFQTRKRALADRQATEPTSGSSPELAAALQRIARLEASTSRLEAERLALLDQFARWAFNAHSRGLSYEILNRPLPPVDRDQTKAPPASSRRTKTETR